MRVLVLTKRYTSAKDISRENVGRPYCLFAALQTIGNSVSFLLADYISKETLDVKKGQIQMKIRPLSLFRIFAFRRLIERMLLEGGFDLLIAEGDPIFALLAKGACARVGIPMIYDLMDNYETYDIYRLPFFRIADRRLIKGANAVVCVTESLKQKVSSRRMEDIYVVGNGVDLEMFHPMDRRACREKLGLPGDAKIIGYFGHIVDYKGIDLLLEAHKLLLKRAPSVLLLLAGKKDRAVRLPSRNCSYGGLIQQIEVPEYINAADLIVVPGPENAFTRYSFPLKILEAMACNVPVIATDIGPARELLGDGSRWLSRPGDPQDLAVKLEEVFNVDTPNLREAAARYSWESMAERLEKILKRIVP